MLPSPRGLASGAARPLVPPFVRRLPATADTGSPLPPWVATPSVRLMTEERVIGRPRQKPPLSPDQAVTADGVAPVITAGQLTALGQRLGCGSQAEFAEHLGITQGYLSHLLGGRRQLQDGPLLRLLVDLLRRHRVTQA